MEILSQQQIERVSSAVAGLKPSQLAWVSGYLTSLTIQAESGLNKSATNALVQSSPLEQPASNKITILYGSQTGNSKRIAEELHNALLADGIHSSLNNLLDYRPAQLKKEQKLIFVISTQGNGEPPDETLGFFKYIESDRAPKLEHIEYAVLGLGDSSYDEFCETGISLDKRLASLGAKHFLNRVDADIDFEETAAVWQKDIITFLEAESGSEPDSTHYSSDISDKNNSSAISLSQSAGLQQWSESNPYQAELLGVVNLTAEGSEQEVYHLELAIDDYGEGYKPGDIIALLPKNQPVLVEQILNETGLDGSGSVTIKNHSIALYDALLSKLEVSKLTSKVVKSYAEATASQELHGIVGDKVQLREFIKDKDLLDLLQAYPEDIDAQQLVDSLRPLLSRQYSIASSAETHTDEVHILVKPVIYEHQGREHLGTASNWLKDQQIGDTIPLYIKQNHSFKLPTNPDEKIIMIGAGTGVAPYRSFLFERESQGCKGNSWLFFGEQRFQSDFLYQTEWQKFIKDSTLERMNVAFSRDQSEKIYVQHKLLEEAETLYQWLEEGAYIYVCGDINRMAADVHQALIKIVSEQSNKSREEAENWLDELKVSKRYQRDVY